MQKQPNCLQDLKRRLMRREQGIPKEELEEFGLDEDPTSTFQDAVIHEL